jgi:uncharacterized membrane protein
MAESPPEDEAEKHSGTPGDGGLVRTSPPPQGAKTEPPLKAEIMDPDRPTETRREMIISASYYEGVLPPPEYFEKLERIVPGAAKQILESYLKQATHRQNNENKVITANIEARTLGMKLGAGLACLGIIGGCIVAGIGYPGTGASIAGATALALATSYLKALADHGKDLANKKGLMDKLGGRSVFKPRPAADAGRAPGA